MRSSDGCAPMLDAVERSHAFLPVLQNYQERFVQTIDEADVEKMVGHVIEHYPTDREGAAAGPPATAFVIGYTHTVLTIGAEVAHQWFLVTDEKRQLGLVDGWVIKVTD
jgi:hypothetical protein